MSSEECTLFPGWFGMFVQLILFLLCLCTLLLKKKREDWREGCAARSWLVFCLDSTKQLVGNFTLHVLNCVCATVLNSYMVKGDVCQWYWVNIVLDTTLGVVVACAILHCLLIPCLEKCTGSRGLFLSGQYKDSKGCIVKLKYFLQLGCWVLCVTLMKAVMSLIMVLFSGTAEKVSYRVLSLFPWGADFRLVLVMVITPCVMNCMQLWVQDAFLKAKSRPQRLPDMARPLQLDEPVMDEEAGHASSAPTTAHEPCALQETTRGVECQASETSSTHARTDSEASPSHDSISAATVS